MRVLHCVDADTDNAESGPTAASAMTHKARAPNVYVYRSKELSSVFRRKNRIENRRLNNLVLALMMLMIIIHLRNILSVTRLIMAHFPRCQRVAEFVRSHTPSSVAVMTREMFPFECTHSAALSQQTPRGKVHCWNPLFFPALRVRTE